MSDVVEEVEGDEEEGDEGEEKGDEEGAQRRRRRRSSPPPPCFMGQPWLQGMATVRRRRQPRAAQSHSAADARAHLAQSA